MFENGFLVSPEIIKNRERIEEKYIDKFLQHDSTQFTKPPKKLLKKNQELTFCSNSITNLDKINDDLGKCTSNLAIVTTEKAAINAELSSKTSNLESCQKDLSKTENERDGFKTKFEQVTVQYDKLTQKDKEQEGQISDLKMLNVN